MNPMGLPNPWPHHVGERALRATCRAYDAGQPNLTEAPQLEEFAVTTYSDARALSELRGLRWRKRLGPRLCRLLQPFLVLTAAQRLHSALRRRRLLRVGL